MSFSLHRPGFQFSVLAASAINPYTTVRLVGTDKPLAISCGSINVEPFGLIGAGTAGASGLDQAEFVTVYEAGNIVKALCAASVGAGAVVGVASDNGGLGPVAQASGTLKWAVGVALSPAAAGETFACKVHPRTLGGNA